MSIQSYRVPAGTPRWWEVAAAAIVNPHRTPENDRNQASDFRDLPTRADMLDFLNDENEWDMEMLNDLAQGFPPETARAASPTSPLKKTTSENLIPDYDGPVMLPVRANWSNANFKLNTQTGELFEYFRPDEPVKVPKREKVGARISGIPPPHFQFELELRTLAGTQKWKLIGTYRTAIKKKDLAGPRASAQRVSSIEEDEEINARLDKLNFPPNARARALAKLKQLKQLKK